MSACVEFAVDPDEDDPGDVAITVTEAIAAGRCPRCSGPLGDYPAGSRITACRCIPICSTCGGQEPFVLFAVTCWPVTQADHDLMMASSEWRTAEVSTGITDGEMVITEDGSTPLRGRPHPGGWLEFGWSE
jgi:hypothetical protein